MQIDLDPTLIGMRYPYEVNLVGDAATTLRALIPLLRAQGATARGARASRTTSRAGGRPCDARLMVDADPVNPMRLFCELSPRLPDDAIVTADSGSSANWYARQLRFRGEHARLAVGQPRDDGPGRAVRHRCQVRPPGPSGGRVRRRRRDADERAGRADHGRAVLARVERPAPGRRGAAQQRPQPGHLGDAGHGRARRSSWSRRPCRTSTTPGSPRSLGLLALHVDKPEEVGPAWDRALAADRPAVLDVRCRPERAAHPAARDVRADQGRGRGPVQGDEDRWGWSGRA